MAFQQGQRVRPTEEIAREFSNTSLSIRPIGEITEISQDPTGAQIYAVEFQVGTDTDKFILFEDELEAVTKGDVEQAT